MDEKQPTSEELQQILDENARIIQIIMKSQSEGRMMDCLLYQTRLHLNLVQLASLADNRPHPSIGVKNENKGTSKKSKTDKKANATAFIQAIKENGMKDLDLISKITSISLTEVHDLCTSFIDFLKRENRFSEATKYEGDLEFYHSIKAKDEAEGEKVGEGQVEIFQKDIIDVKKEAEQVPNVNDKNDAPA